MKTKLTMVVAMAVACASIQLTAMPTEEETRKAEPVVKKMLASEKAALESGRKTRSEVAAAAMKLAGEADTDAAKLLLMKGAFVLYVKDGNIEKAVETMRALGAAISDMPPQSVTNMIEAVLHGTAQKKDGAQLYKLLDELKKNTAGNEVQKVVTSTKDSATETKRQIFSRMFPGWQTSVEPTIESSHRGQDNVAFVHPPSQGTSAVVSRVLTLSKKKPCLFLTMASFHGGSDFLLSVLVNGKEVLPKQLISTPDYAPWQDFTVPLFAWRGQEVKVEVVVTANGWYYKSASFKRLEIAEGSGRENLIPEAKETVDGYTWSYRVQNGEATIISEKEGKMSCAVSPKPVGSIVIPDILGGAKVTSIGQWALAGCQELESVTIPQGVKRIGSVAFLECKKLKSVEIPSSVIGIGWCAFHRCNALASVNIPSDSDLKGLENGAFADCLALKSISLPDGVTRIARHAFRRCFNLKSLTIPAAASRIGGEAFRYCANLSSVTMLGEKPDTSVPPEYMTHTSDNIFLDCGNLKAIHVPANAKSWAGMKEWHGIPLVFDGEDIGRQAQTEGVRGRLLSRRGRLRNIRAERAAGQQQATVDGYTWSYRVRNGEATLMAEKDGKPSCAVSPAPTGKISIPATLNGVKVTRIGGAAFRYCKELMSVTIPEGVTHIDNHAFNHCYGLKSVTLPSSLKYIGWAAFGKCAELTSVEIPNGVESIEPDALSGCGFKSVVIPESVTRIGDRAFCGCGELESVTIPAGVASIGNGVFGECNALKMINVDSANQAFTAIDGVLYSKDRSELVMWPNPPASAVIPKDVTSIRGWAFAGGKGMTSVMIPESVTNIEDVVFLGCEGLKSITIPASVKSIGEHAFERCGELAEVTMRGERPEAPKNLFPGCGKLKAIHVSANAKSWAGKKDWHGIPLVFDVK